MKKKMKKWSAAIGMVVLGIGVFCGYQKYYGERSRTYTEEELEIMQLVQIYQNYKDTLGENEEIPEDFIFDVDGKQMKAIEFEKLIENNAWLSQVTMRELPYFDAGPEAGPDARDYYLGEMPSYDVGLEAQDYYLKKVGNFE